MCTFYSRAGLLALCLAAALPALSQSRSFIKLSGFNQDLVAEGTGNAPLATQRTTTTVDAPKTVGSNKVLYTKNFRGGANATTAPPYGLPDDGIIGAANDNYQLAPYDANNSVLLVNNGDSAVLSLLPNNTYEIISAVGLNAQGTSTVTLRIHYADSTSLVQTTNLVYPDWFLTNASYPIVQSAMGRTDRDTDAFDGTATNPHLFRYTFTLSAADRVKPIRSLVFRKTAGSGRFLFMAASGTNALSAPVLLPADSLSPTSFKASWRSVPNATAYHWEVSTDSLFRTYAPLYLRNKATTDTTVTVTGLAANTTYYYRVRAARAGGSSLYTRAAQVPTFTGLFPTVSVGQVAVYPNPNNGGFFLTGLGTGNVYIEMLNALGRPVATFSNRGQNTIRVNENVPSGLYILRISQRGNTQLRRVQINR